MHTPEQIERLAARLKEAPALPKALTTAEAIRKLAPSIRAMQAKGYDLDLIAETLKAEGLAVSGKTLARHLRGSKVVCSSKKAPASAAAAASVTPPMQPSE